MAFSIKRKATDFKAAHWIERHLPLSQRCFGIATNEQIEAVQADGHELRYIRESYTGIPIGPAVVHTWRGDMARIRTLVRAGKRYVQRKEAQCEAQQRK